MHTMKVIAKYHNGKIVVCEMPGPVKMAPLAMQSNAKEIYAETPNGYYKCLKRKDPYGYDDLYPLSPKEAFTLLLQAEVISG